MPRRKHNPWAQLFGRSVALLTGNTLRAGSRMAKQALKPAAQRRAPPPGAGDWLPGVAIGPGGARRFRLYRPPGVKIGERLPLMVMLHGCGQDAKGFALSTRMNSLATRERFLVLYPEQDRLANAQGCWNWFDTRSGRAYAEATLILAAIDQVCLLYPADRQRVALVGLSAGASMAALLATRHPQRFKAVVMHSGVPPGSAHSPMSALRAMHGHQRAALAPVSRPLLQPAPQPLLQTATPGEGSAWPPLLVIHGADDTVVSASNGVTAAKVWADATGARAIKSRVVQRGRRHAMTLTDFKRKGRTVVTLAEVGRLGHAWSGGALKQPFSDALGPDATRMAWAFALRQFGA
ncbi:alpha/beta hydrolase family esterase [Aquabacterium sp.]|uniref:extracellular catalytic domain type 1 short-chain-length polyhydroxyalkanoate depolymerase n=1 Tax=Aquabacterium sp. TaxID=1872578 RepID=UPI002B88292B|nr:PHB depolymerase family esterase [Aquabacterium sp.]HSW04614.1 PHB depolymerase family esterase [Aquabacterium sp.]